MKLKNLIIAIAAVTAAGGVIVAQNGGVQRTAAAVASFFERFGIEAAFAVDQQDAPAVGLAESQSATDYRWTGSLAAGRSLEIKGVNGSITVERAPGDEVVVTAEARARRSDPSAVRVERLEHGEGLTFCAVYPTPEGERANECAPGSSGRMSTHRNDVQVDFRIEVPAGVSFIGRTVNGGVEAIDLESDVVAVTVNGDIEISTTGFAEAETVNGSIEASMGSDIREGVSFSTVNGSISLDLPDDINADIDASWLNGSFESDVPFLLEGRVSRRSARGMLGAGGPELELETVNGSIRIR